MINVGILVHQVTSIQTHDWQMVQLQQHLTSERLGDGISIIINRVEMIFLKISLYT